MTPANHPFCIASAAVTRLPRLLARFVALILWLIYVPMYEGVPFVVCDGGLEEVEKA